VVIRKTMSTTPNLIDVKNFQIGRSRFMGSAGAEGEPGRLSPRGGSPYTPASLRSQRKFREGSGPAFGGNIAWSRRGAKGTGGPRGTELVHLF
jgi:hypothetical protein